MRGGARPGAGRPRRTYAITTVRVSHEVGAVLRSGTPTVTSPNTITIHEKATKEKSVTAGGGGNAGNPEATASQQDEGKVGQVQPILSAGGNRLGEGGQGGRGQDPRGSTAA